MDIYGICRWCERCNQPSQPEFRYILSLAVKDHTTEQWLTAFQVGLPRGIARKARDLSSISVTTSCCDGNLLRGSSFIAQHCSRCFMDISCSQFRCNLVWWYVHAATSSWKRNVARECVWSALIFIVMFGKVASMHHLFQFACSHHEPSCWSLLLDIKTQHESILPAKRCLPLTSCCQVSLSDILACVCVPFAGIWAGHHGPQRR